MKHFDYVTRVRYGETDQMGVAYYAHYFNWFEVARTEFFRSLGLVYSEFERKGVLLPVAEANCRYNAPATYDDQIVVRTIVTQVKQSSIRFEYQVLKNNSPRPIATGYTIHVFTNRELKPLRIPDELRSKIEISESLFKIAHLIQEKKNKCQR